MNHMTGAEFITAMYCDACLYDGLPSEMTTEDAAYNLREYLADGIPVPVTVTPKLFAGLWNLLRARDLQKGGTAA